MIFAIHVYALLNILNILEKSNILDKCLAVEGKKTEKILD